MRTARGHRSCSSCTGVYNTHNAKRQPYPRVGEGRLGLETGPGFAPHVRSSSARRHRRRATSQAGARRWPCRCDSQTGWPLIMRYPIAIEPRTERSEYGVVIPDLQGAFSAGETLDEAIAGAEEAGLAWIDAALDAGEVIPGPSPLESIR